MAFSLANAGASGFNTTNASSNAGTQTGPDLEEIETENLGFHSIAGEAKVRLLPCPWPSNDLPPPTASLLSIASRRGILAAAGPDSVIIAGTESIRQAFSFSASDTGGGNVKSFTPQLALNLGMRISQVAFSADEEYLVLSAQNGGGLAVYEVQALMQGTTTAAFELPTNGRSLRALVQNPTPEKAELFAIVTENGDLMMANLKTRDFVGGSQQQVMKDGVSCVSWSTKGKQLVAGLGNGVCSQMTPEGQIKAEIPVPSDLEGEYHVASISWLENNVFLAGHNRTGPNDPMDNPTTFHVITRQANEGPFLFQKLPEVCPPFGLDRRPPHFFMQRLKDFPPNIQDLIIVTSTASGDVGLFSRATAPLASDFPAEKITNVFTTTSMANDSRRAQLPMSDSMEDTSPIGTVVDLSAKEKVLRPLPGEEMDASPGPVPALMILNNEGLLSAWWIIYADSIRQGTKYSGLLSEGHQSQNQREETPQPAAFGGNNSQPEPAFGLHAQGVARGTAFGGAGVSMPSQSIFSGGNTQSQTTSAFGAPSAPGASSSPWTSTGFANPSSQSGTSSFGKPSFGSPSTIGGTAAAPAFGTAGGIGNRGSVWGALTQGAPQTAGSVFGQSSGLGMRSGSVLGAASSSGTFGSALNPGSSATSSQGGFAGFAKDSGSAFLSAASQSGGESPFAKINTGQSTNSTMETDTLFGGTSQKSVNPPSLFSPSGFTLGSTFTSDGSAKTDLPKPTSSTKSSMFGDDFGNTLEGARKDVPPAQSKEADMIEGDSDMAGSESSDGSLPTRETRTPAAKPSQSNSIVDTSTPKSSGLFGTQSQTTTTPAAVQSSTPAPSILGSRVHPTTTTPAETPQRRQESPFNSQTPPSPSIKPEPEEQETPVGVPRSIPEAPMPPESTSKVSYAPGDSSTSSKSSAEDVPLHPEWVPSKTKLDIGEKPTTKSEKPSADDGNAPLPPDFVPSKPKPRIVETHVEEAPQLPLDDEDDGLDDEGSGVDVAQEISPTSDSNQSPRITPVSSFGASFGPSPLSGVFSKAQQPRQHVNSLFGEVQQPNIPFLPPPNRTQQSPRSPSPVRLVPPGDGLRPENARSISAPNRPLVTTAQKQAGRPSASVTSTNYPSAQQQRQKEKESATARQARQQAEEEQDLSDREDERVREELETEVEATTTLDDFLAHQDYVGTISKPGIPGQIEKVYRDINSMVDTLGLNARALTGFVKGHSMMAKDGGRSFDDLEDTDWCLMEIEDLGILEGQIQDQLAQGRLEDVQGKLNICRDMRKDLSKLRSRRTEMARAFEALPNEEQIKVARFAPLSASQTTQQHEIRKRFTKVQKLIAEAEENITLLRARLASHERSDGKAALFKKPTVEAVTNTILKMTSMVEKKSGDIDVLEAQLRKLRFASANQDSSREGSPLAVSPRPLTSPVVKTLGSTVPGLVESPSNSFRRSAGDGGTPRRRMSGITAEEVIRYRAKMQRRKEVNQIMREAFAKAGPRIRSLE